VVDCEPTFQKTGARFQCQNPGSRDWTLQKAVDYSPPRRGNSAARDQFQIVSGSR